MPIELGLAKLQKSKHTFVHYYDTHSLTTEFDTLKRQYSDLARNASADPQIAKMLEPQVKTIDFTMSQIQTKLDFLRPKTRPKRGLLNVLGSGIKLVTGNLDESDGERYEKILNQLKSGEAVLENQVKSEYSISNKLISKFDKTIRDIKHNEELYEHQFQEYMSVYNNRSSIEKRLLIKEIFNQFAVAFLSFLNLVSDVENSVLFCHVNTLHPSIINPRDLLFELKRVETYYKEKLPTPATIENLPFLEEITQVDCKITNDQIIYFLSIPINEDPIYTLFYLLPIPSLHNSEYVSVQIPHRYVLKHEDTIIPLKGPCTHLQAYQCEDPDISSQPKCETTLLNRKTSEDCEHAQLEITTNHLEAIPYGSTSLGIFKDPERIKLDCPQQKNEQTLTGIYVINQKDCKVFFRNHTIPKALKSETKPIFFDNSVILEDDIPNLNTKLKFITLNDKAEITNMIPPNLDVDFVEDNKTHTIFYFLILSLVPTVVALNCCITRAKNFKGYFHLRRAPAEDLAANPDLTNELRNLRVTLNPTQNTEQPANLSFR